jgi:TolB-like protein
VLAIGFPVTLIFSWVYEFTPDGLKLERDIDPTRSNTRYSGAKLDRMIIVALALALGYFAIDKFLLRDETLVDTNGDLSVAVLPFEDMSPSGDQAYFGDGMAVQLLDELSRLDGLRVAPRTSSFSFKETSTSLSAIAEALNVATIVEGSIRKDGDQIRITAQLINIADGEILWSETYDRKLENIFAIQEEIATAVSGALGVSLGVGEVNAFIGAGTRNFEAYETYLKAASNRDGGIPNLNRAIELDPNYAAAWSLLAAYTLVQKGWYVYPGDNRENEERAIEFARRAVELNPESAQSLAQLGLMLEIQEDWIGAEEVHVKAISLLSARLTHGHYASFLMRAGRSTDALKQFERSEAAEPLRGRHANRVHAAIAQGRFADARDEWAPYSSFPPHKGVDLYIALHEGDSEEIKAMMAAMGPTQISTIELFAPVLKVFDSREMVLTTLRAVYADGDARWSSKLTDIGLLAAYFGDEELALQAIGEEARLGSYRFGAVWYPLMASVRQSQGFKELVTEYNLVEYWRASGWPDRCRPLGADDFECW